MLRRAPRTGRAIAVLAAVLGALLIAVVGIAGGAGQASAQGRFDFFLTLKYGRQTAENSGDTIIEDFEGVHGDLQDDREVETLGLELDLLTFPSARAGVGMGFEYHQYFKKLRFSDPSGVKPPGRINIRGRALLYTLKFYARLGPIYPFLGLGSGIYVVNYSENGLPSVFEGSPQVVHGRVGARILMGRWSLLLEYGQTRAPLEIQTRPNMPVLELGGVYSAVGLGRSF